MPDIPERPVPAVPADVRISDAERDRAITFLRHHTTEGRLTLDEFADRLDLVYASRTAGELELITRDLPATGSTAGLTTPMRSTTPTEAGRMRRAARFTVSVFSANGQRGRWRIEGETVAISVMGGCHLDLRQAEVVGPEAIITAIAVMGGVDVVVPEGIEVELTGFGFMGGNTKRVAKVPVIPGSPVVRVRAFSLMGGVTVRSKPQPGAKGMRAVSDRDRRRAGQQAKEQGRRADQEARHEARHEDRKAQRDDRKARPHGSRPATPAPSAPAASPVPPAAAARRDRVRGIDALTGAVRDEWPELRARVAPEGTVTLLFSDIEGFTGITERLGDRTAQELLRQHYRIVREQLAQHHGFEVKVQGDGFMLAFDSAVRALRCAVGIQGAQGTWNEVQLATGEETLRVRMGLHTGEAIRDVDDFIGSAVNTAARIAGEARGEEILVSALLRELCASTGEFSFTGGDEIELRGLSQPQRIYALAWR